MKKDDNLVLNDEKIALYLTPELFKSLDETKGTIIPITI